jgi:hypothetical protein
LSLLDDSLFILYRKNRILIFTREQPLKLFLFSSESKNSNCEYKIEDNTLNTEAFVMSIMMNQVVNKISGICPWGYIFFE